MVSQTMLSKQLFLGADLVLALKSPVQVQVLVHGAGFSNQVTYERGEECIDLT